MHEIGEAVRKQCKCWVCNDIIIGLYQSGQLCSHYTSESLDLKFECNTNELLTKIYTLGKRCSVYHYLM